MSKVCMVGTGYVGVVTGAGLASIGHDVVGVDIVEEKIKKLQRGRAPFHERGLNELLRKGIRENRLHFTTKIQEGLRGCKYAIVAVPTPANRDGSPDLKFVYSVLDDIAKHAHNGLRIIVKSTVPVGCFADLRKRLKEHGKTYELVSNPEFLAEGTAVKDFLEPSRTIVGARTRPIARSVDRLYKDIPGPHMLTTPETAQFIKYVSNVMLALRVSFINLIAVLCERFPGVDVLEVSKGVLMDPRAGKGYLLPGVGYSGACLPKDLEALIYSALQVGVDIGFLRAIHTQNTQQLHRVVGKICKMVPRGGKVAAFGLAFKAGTSDVRYSRPMEIIRELAVRDRIVVGTDPVAVNDEARRELPGIELTRDPYKAAAVADCIAILTGWPQYSHMRLSRLAQVVASKQLFDGPGIFDPRKVIAAGFSYSGIGRTA